MKILRAFAIAGFCLSSFACHSQQTLPDAPSPAPPSNPAARPTYAPPNQAERAHAYLKSTFSVNSLLEAGFRAGIQQARDVPSSWPQGAEGFGDRFGSAAGEIVIRNSTKYVLADLFKEDIRFIPCGPGCTQSKVVAAFEDTFMARKGDDGHRGFSVAQLVSPLSGSAVAVSTWYPPGSNKSEIATQTGIVFGVELLKNYVKELRAH